MVIPNYLGCDFMVKIFRLPELRSECRASWPVSELGANALKEQPS